MSPFTLLARTLANFVLETTRLHLRPYELSDYPSYLAMCSDLKVMHFLGGKPLSPEDAWNRVMRYAGHWSLLDYGIFAVIEKETGRYIGETGLADCHRGLGEDFDRSDEAAWVFSGDAQGRGYAIEAAKAAHGWYGTQRDRARTVCLIHPDNHLSLKLADKLGYRVFGEQSYKGYPTLMLERHHPKAAEEVLSIGR